MAYTRKDYLGSRAETTLNGGINASTTSITITSATGWPTIANGGHYAVIDPGSPNGATEEKVLVTARTTTSLTVTRGVDGTTGVSHSSGATIRPSMSAVDFDEANYMVAETVGNITAAGDLLVGAGTNDLTRLAVGSASTILAVNSGGTLGYTTAATAMFADSAVTNAKLNGMTRGTIKVGNSSGVASDLALGASGYYLTSDGTDVAWGVDPGGWTTLRKASNQSFSSATPTADNDFSFTPANGTTYYFEVFVVYGGGPDTNLIPQLGVNTSGVAYAFGGACSFMGTASGAATSYAKTGFGSDSVTTAAGKNVLFFTGAIVGDGSTFPFSWQKGGAGTGNNTTTVYAGSYLRYRTIT